MVFVCQTQSLKKSQQYFKIAYLDFRKLVFSYFRFPHFKDLSIIQEARQVPFLMKIYIPTKQHGFKHISKYSNNTESEHAKIKVI